MSPTHCRSREDAQWSPHSPPQGCNSIPHTAQKVCQLYKLSVLAIAPDPRTQCCGLHPRTQSPMGLICLAIAVEHWNLRCSWRALSSSNICLQCGHFTLPSSLIPTCSRVPLPDTASLLISMVSGMAAGEAVEQRQVTASRLGHPDPEPKWLEPKWLE